MGVGVSGASFVCCASAVSSGFAAGVSAAGGVSLTELLESHGFSDSASGAGDCDSAEGSGVSVVSTMAGGGGLCGVVVLFAGAVNFTPRYCFTE